MSTDADHDGHDHDHDHGDHSHEHPSGLKGIVSGIFAPHSHDAADSIDTALESSRRGIRAVKISFVALLITSALQLAVIVISGSIALVADTIHNFSDALTAIPLFIAFRLVRRPPRDGPLPPRHVRTAHRELNRSRSAIWNTEHRAFAGVVASR